MIASLLLVFAQADVLSGVKAVATPGLPGTVSILDNRGSAFLVGREEGQWRPVAATSQLGSGRVAVFGHDGYLSEGAMSAGDTARLMRNVLLWAANRTNPRIGYLPGRGHERTLARIGLNGTAIEPGRLDRVDVIMADAAFPTQGLADYVRNGGGLVAANTGWGWLQLNPGKNLSDGMPLNSVLTAAGLAISDGTAEEIRPNSGTETYRALDALNRLSRGEKADAGLVLSALRATPKSTPIWAEARSKTERAPAPVPTAAKPLKSSDGLARLSVAIRSLSRPGGEGAADPAAADYPGQPAPQARRRTVSVKVPVSMAHWASTGTYATAGQEVTVEVPPELRTGGLRVQVGCHSDTLWHLAEWQRNPSIVVSKRIEGPVTRITSPFGGLVYIVVDQPLRQSAASVTIKNVVKAGRFILGQTTMEQWRQDLNEGAPWAEFESGTLIFSVPTAEARKVPDPTALMRLWDRTMGLYSELDGQPLLQRAERIVCDRQISAGYMHSGYPIMTWSDDSIPLSLSVERLTKEGTWGHWHELGHNRQLPEWTFDGTGEVTNNIYTLYMMQRIANQPPAVRLAETKPRVTKHLTSGAPFDTWKSDPFLALTMYADLIEGFGWDAMRQWFRDYTKGAKPRNDQEKRDQFLTRYSRTVGRNLSPFFQKWGVPTSEAARSSLTDLQDWNGPARN